MATGELGLLSLLQKYNKALLSDNFPLRYKISAERGVSCAKGELNCRYLVSGENS